MKKKIDTEYSTTMIHGRFQPFHNGHLDYFMRALKITTQRLIVGITNPYPELILKEATDDHRHLLGANPFTFYERYRMISESVKFHPALINGDIELIIVPFPIHHKELWRFFIPPNAVQVMSIFEDWDVEKKNRFVAYGFKVHELQCERMVSGEFVRSNLKKLLNVGEISNLAPTGTINVLNELNNCDILSRNN